MAVHRISRITQGADHIGVELGRMCHDHYGAVNKVGSIGLATGSCCAAVAVTGPRAQGWSHSQYSLSNGFCAIFGNSRLYRGHDPDNNKRLIDVNTRLIDRGAAVRGNNNPFSSTKQEQHAEQVTILMADDQQLDLLITNNIAHIYVDLEPCSTAEGGCLEWLKADARKWDITYGYTSSSDMKARDFPV